MYHCLKLCSLEVFLLSIGNYLKIKLMNKPLISVIVPCYNHSQFIVEALESVLNQSYINFECIIVNDGSTDNTEEVVLNWIQIDRRFKYIYQENAGVSSARNTGISQSSGLYILPLDSDDKISDNYLENCFNILELHAGIKVVYGDAYMFGKSKKKWNLDDYNFEDILYKNMIYCTALFRKEDWVKVGGYDENLKDELEDWEFWINILKNEGEVLKINNCYFYYRVKDISRSTESVLKNQYGYKSRVYIFEKHLELYRKTNFYDMYFENYKLKKAVKNPLTYLSINDLFVLLFKASYSKFIYLFSRIKTLFITRYT